MSNCEVESRPYELNQTYTQCDKNASKIARESQSKRVHTNTNTATDSNTSTSICTHIDRLVANNDCTVVKKTYVLSQFKSQRAPVIQLVLSLQPHTLALYVFVVLFLARSLSRALSFSLSLSIAYCVWLTVWFYKTMYVYDTYLNLRVRFILVPTMFEIPFSRDGLNVKIFTRHSNRLSSKAQKNKRQKMTHAKRKH